MSWTNVAAEQMIANGVPEAQAYAAAAHMQHANYSAAEVQRAIGEQTALFGVQQTPSGPVGLSPQEVAQRTGYSVEHIPAKTIVLQPGQTSTSVIPQPEAFNPFNVPTGVQTVQRKTETKPVSTPAAAPSPFRGVFTSTTPAAVTPAPSIIKTPERFLSTFQENITAQSLEKLLFENIGGIELANIIRHDTVEGTNPYYKIISNLSRIRLQLDPISLVASQRASLTPGDFGRQITLFTKIPLQNYLDNNNLDNYIFIDDDDTSPTYGHLIIELVNLDADEFVEVEIATSGTIYEVEQ